MSLAPGAKLGPYEIQSPLGAGGMGEVYRARDTRLERTVAIKVLPGHFSSDPLRKQRFEREAKTISSLNHPHICVLYDIGHQDGIDYLVMECVEGESLAKRLEKGPLPLEQVLKYGAQIADALDKAHHSGVIHRDLKPGNIMLTPAGAKLLDFGLAKPITPLATGATLTAAADQSRPLTEEGTIVGTFQYMSPEQVEGKDADGRSDIFSLGAVLYEMLTGQRAFQGKSQLSVASAILEKEPAPISSIKPLTPHALDHAIRCCLAKDREERWQTARDLARELKWIAEDRLQAGASAAPLHENQRRGWLAWGVALAAALTVLVLGLRLSRGTSQLREVVRYTVSPPEGGRFVSVGGFHGSPVLSPDGRNIAFIARVSGITQVWVRPLNSLAAHPLPSTEHATSVFWSPDSQNIAFVADDKLRRIAVAGGSPQTVCEVDGLIGGSWSRQDVIVFANRPSPIYRVPASGGTPHRVTTLDAKRQDFLHMWPFFLPDGNHFLYLASPTPTVHESNAIFVGSLDGKENRMLFRTGSPVVYADGYLLYLAGQTLMARPFDAGRLAFTGDSIAVAEGVLLDPYYVAAAFSASENGVLVYQQGKPFNGYQLTLMSRDGKQLDTIKNPGLYWFPRFSPDAKRVSYHSPDLQTGKTDVWVWDIASGNRARLTFNSMYNRTAVWSPDGTRVAYIASQPGSASLFISPVGSSGTEMRRADLTATYPILSQWTPEGKYFVFADSSLYFDSERPRIAFLPVQGNEPASTLLEASGSVDSGFVSPDGRWLAFRSRETGRSEVYITSFPKPSRKLQVSVGSGPRWRGDGKELFFVAPDGKLIVAEFKEINGSLQVGAVRPLSQIQPLSPSHYDVTADGNRFVLLAVTADETSEPLNVVVNWTAELTRK